MRSLLATFTGLALLAPAAAQAAASEQGTVPVNGSVAVLCSGGSLAGDDGVFALGVLIDTATGLMLQNLSAPPKTVVGSFCNTRSTITISATPMAAQGFTGPAPDGFTNALDYTATASGWTTTAASYTTGAGTHPEAVQSRESAFTGTITVVVGGFAPSGGANLRPVADPSYKGTITLTLAVAA